MRKGPALALALVMTGCPALADDAGLARFFGQWQGVEIEVSDPALDLEPDHLDVTITGAEDGFRVRWTALERGLEESARIPRRLDARFRETGRAGVYAFATEPGSLLSRLFAAPATGNPLEGETLLWARIEDDTLIVYSLALTLDGGFDLDRYARTPSGEDGAAMHLVHERRSEHRVVVIEGRLRREGD